MHVGVKTGLIITGLVMAWACGDAPESGGAEPNPQLPEGVTCGGVDKEKCEKEGEGYIFEVIVTTNPPDLGVFVKVYSDEESPGRTLERRTPINIKRFVAKREKDIQLLVTPEIITTGRTFCSITKFGGHNDGELLDWVNDGSTVREIQCIKPRGK